MRTPPSEAVTRRELEHLERALLRHPCSIRLKLRIAEEGKRLMRILATKDRVESARTRELRGRIRSHLLTADEPTLVQVAQLLGVAS